VSHKISHETNGGHFRNITTLFFRLGASKLLLHLNIVVFNILHQSRQVTVICYFHVLSEVLAMLDEVGSLLEFVKSLTGVVQNKEVEKLLQVLVKVTLALLVLA
jgi:hypothetical protein